MFACQKVQVYSHLCLFSFSFHKMTLRKMLLLEFIIIQTVHFPKVFEMLTVSLLSFCIIMYPRIAVLLISLPLFSSLATSHVSVSNLFSFNIGYFVQPSFPLPFLNDTCLLTLLLGLSLRYLKVYSS